MLPGHNPDVDITNKQRAQLRQRFRSKKDLYDYFSKHLVSDIFVLYLFICQFIYLPKETNCPLHYLHGIMSGDK